MQEGFRQLTSHEHAILERLLEVPFDGCDSAREQLPHLLARSVPECIEHCGSVELMADASVPFMPHEGSHESKVDAEGWAIDDDGIPIEILLFQKEGRLSYLEFVVFSDKLKRRLRAHEIEVGTASEISDRHSGEGFNPPRE